MAGYQIKVTMEYVKPPMWRRLAIPDKITFADLHDALQVAFGWDGGHLHDFSFQHFNRPIADTTVADADFDERDIAVDDFLKDGWIRYTYDFGDDWRHKIVLEKELPEYGFRYPQVIKFKRDNFAEDSGGVWSDETQGEYDLVAVNAILAERCICTPSDQYQTMGDLEKELNDFEEYVAKMDEISAMQDVILEQLRVDTDQGEYSGIDEALNRLDDLYDQDENGKSGKSHKQKKRCMVKHSKRIMEQLLYEVGERGLEIYLKYLGQPIPKNHTVVNLARKVSACIKEHPEYLYLVLEENEIRQYLAYYRGNGMMELPAREMLVVCAMLGLVEVEVEGDKLSVTFPADMEPIAEWIERGLRPELYTTIHDTWGHIRSLLACYGFADINVLYDAYVKAFGDMDPTEFRCYLYLMGSFCGRIVTGTMYDGTFWSALEDGMAVAAVVGQGEYADGLEYVRFSKEQVLNMEAGFGKIYPQWDKVLFQFARMGMEEQEAMRVMSMIYEVIMGGAGMGVILEAIREALPEASAGGEFVKLQYALAKCWCEMGIPALKGHSRKEIARERKVSAFEVASDDGFRMPELV